MAVPVRNLIHTRAHTCINACAHPCLGPPRQTALWYATLYQTGREQVATQLKRWPLCPERCATAQHATEERRVHGGGGK